MNNQSDLIRACESALAWVRHWKEDKDSGFTPTDGSLAECEAELSAAISKAKKAR